MEQDKHTFQLKYSCESANLASVQRELENVQAQLQDQHKDEIKRIEEMAQRKAHLDAQASAGLKASVEKLEVLYTVYACVAMMW